MERFNIPLRPTEDETEDDLVAQQQRFLHSMGASNGQGGVSSQRRTSNSPHKVDNSRTGMTPNFSKNPQSVQHEDVNTVLLPSVSEKCSKSPMSCSTHAPPEPRAAAFAIAEDVVIETEARTDSSGVNARRGTPNRGQVPRKKSLFAQRFDAAKKQATNVGDVSSTFTSTTAGHSQPVTASTASTAHEHAVSRDMGNAEAIPASVNHMNMHRVHAMSDAEITDAHDELRRMFSASSLKFLQTRTATAAESPALTATADPALEGNAPTSSVRPTSTVEEDPEVVAERHVEPLPVSGTGWLNMDTVEKDKLAWTADISDAEIDASHLRHPLRKDEVRFDFSGTPMPRHAPNIGPELGLHHHGDFPDRPGYSLGELVRLCRSSHQPQRILALQTVTKIVSKTWRGEYDGDTHHSVFSGLPGEESASDNVMGCLQGMGYPLFVRGAIDDPAPAMVHVGVAALAALLAVEHETSPRPDRGSGTEDRGSGEEDRGSPAVRTSESADEVFADDVYVGMALVGGGGGTGSTRKETYLWGRDDASSWQTWWGPAHGVTLDADTDAGGDNADNNSSAAQAQARDTERCREDLVGGLLKTHLLYRIRYLLKDSGLLDLQGSTQTRPGKDATAAVAPASAIVLDSNIRVLNVLVRVARHSLSSATAVAECPDLIATLFRRYIDLPRAPASAQEDTSVFAACTGLACKLIRVLCAAGRGVASTTLGLVRDADAMSGAGLAHIVALFTHAHTYLPAARACAVRREACLIVRTCMVYRLRGAKLFVALYPTLLEHVCALTRVDAVDTPPHATAAVALLGMLETAVEMAEEHDAVTLSDDQGGSAGGNNAEEGGVARGEAEDGRGVGGIRSDAVQWRHVEYLHVPAMQLARTLCTSLTNGTMPDGASETARVQRYESLFHPKNQQGCQLRVLSAVLKFLATFIRVEASQPPSVVSVVDAVERVASDFDSLFLSKRTHAYSSQPVVPGCVSMADVLREAWRVAIGDAEQGGPATARGRERKTVVSPQRFMGLPSLLHGGAYAATTCADVALNFIGCAMVYARTAATRHKGLWRSVTGVMDPVVDPTTSLAAMEAYAMAVHNEPRAVDVHDMLLYRQCLHTSVQLLVLRWHDTMSTQAQPDGNTAAVLQRTDQVNATMRALGIRLVTQLPNGHTDNVKYLLSRFVFPPSDMSSAPTAARASCATREGLLQQLQSAAGPLHSSAATTPTQKHSLLLPARSDKTSCLPLRMVWLYEQVRAHAIAVSKFNIGKRTALSDIERARERALLEKLSTLLGAVVFMETSVAVEKSRPTLYANMRRTLLGPPALDVGIRLLHILPVFLGANVYQDSAVAEILQSKLLPLYWTQAADNAVVTWSVAQETKALKLVQDLLEEFVNMSFGDTTFAKFVVLIMQQAFPVDLRLEMYRNDRFLELCTVDTTGMGSGGMHGFLHPRETHLECVELQAMALLGRKIVATRNPLLFAVAAHHVEAFLFADTTRVYNVGPREMPAGVVTGDEHRQRVAQRQRQLLLQVFATAPDDVFRQLVLGSSGSEGGGSDVYALDADRAGYLQSIITSATPDVVQLIHARLPTL